jgi:hypothetical protein
MVKRFFLFVVGFSFLVFSCDILRDSSYLVEAWTPGEGFHNDPESIRVSVKLSHESDKIKTEQAFSLAEDRKPMKGSFSWEGDWLFFTPASPLELNRDYVITLGTGAQDFKGLSLEDKFEVSFTTRLPDGRPRIIKIDPENDGSVVESRGEVRVFFSERISVNSCIDFISFNPYTPGSWRLEDDDKTACFTPRDPWQAGSFYQLRAESYFPGLSGAILGTDFLSVFYIGQDRDKPVLLKALAILTDRPGILSAEASAGEEIPLGISGFPEGEYGKWESFTMLELVFSKPVDAGSVRSLLSIEPSASLVLESLPEPSQVFRFRFVEYPLWGNSFLLRLGPGVKDQAGNESTEDYAFRITCAGPLSKPPALLGIRLPLAPGMEGGIVEQKAVSFIPDVLFADLPIEIGEGQYPYMEKTPSWIELYFETAPGTEIDPFSVMELFRVESTNQALTFSPESVSTEKFTWVDPEEGWEFFQRIEISGMLTNMAQSGIVSFRIPSGLRDLRGNRSNVDFRISLLK